MSGKVLYPDALICESEALEDLEGMRGQGNLSKLQRVPSFAMKEPRKDTVKELQIIKR